MIAHLRARTSGTHTRRYKMLGDTELGGRWVDSLDRAVVLPSGDTVALVDVTPDPRTLPDAHDPDDPRLARALALFEPDERRVFAAKSDDLPWAQAVQEAGLPPAFGETVRRKRGRVVAELKRRGVV